MGITKSVRALEPYVPGEQPKSSDVVKLNTNENPYLPSPRIGAALSSFSLDRLRKYPDPVFRALRDRIGEIYGVSGECVFVGNGSDEVLTLACKAFVEPNEAIGSFNPSYSLYKTLAAIRDVKFVPTELVDDFTWVNPVTDGVSLFMLTNPNAPTSVQYPKERIASFAKSFKGIVLVDEAYADFADCNCVSLAADIGNTNILVMRTLSKSFSLAGLRLGYCIGPKDLIEALYKVKDSYNVDALAQEVALVALNDLDWMRGNVRQVRATRARLMAELRSRGWQMPESSTNFIFAKPAHRSAAEIFAALRDRNIFVRYFPGPRTGDRLRITIGTDSDTDRLLDALAELDRP